MTGGGGGYEKTKKTTLARGCGPRKKTKEHRAENT